MKRVPTTVLALVGADDERLRKLAGALAAGATSAHVPYLVHDADLLASVGAAWAARFDQVGQ